MIRFEKRRDTLSMNKNVKLSSFLEPSYFVLLGIDFYHKAIFYNRRISSVMMRKVPGSQIYLVLQ